MYFLDSDTLTLLYEGNRPIVRRVEEMPEDEVATTIFTYVEVLRGRFEFMLKAANGAELLRAQHLLTQTEEFLAALPIVPLDEKAAAVFDRLRATKGLKKVGRADLLIASVVLAHEATLVSRNLRDFQRIPTLKVVNWAD